MTIISSMIFQAFKKRNNSVCVIQLYGPYYLEKSQRMRNFPHIIPPPIHTADSQMFSFSSPSRNKPHFSVYPGAAKWA